MFASDSVQFVNFAPSTEQMIRDAEFDGTKPFSSLQVGVVFADGVEGPVQTSSGFYSPRPIREDGFAVAGATEKMFINFGTLMNHTEFEFSIGNAYTGRVDVSQQLSLVGQVDLYRDGKLIYSGTFGRDPDDILDTAIPVGFSRSDLIQPDIEVPLESNFANYTLILDGFEFDRVEISPLSWAHGSSVEPAPGLESLREFDQVAQFFGHEVTAIAGAVEFEYRSG